MAQMNMIEAIRSGLDVMLDRDPLAGRSRRCIQSPQA